MIYGIVSWLLWYFVAGFGFELSHMLFKYVFARLNNYKVWKNVYGRYVVVTGASDGIGKELAIHLAKMKQKLILIGRNRSKLEDVRAVALKYTKVCDVVDHDFNNEFSSKLFEGKDVGMLINNAGVCDVHLFHEDESKIDEVIMVNVLTPMNITKVLLRKMGERGSGYVVNLGSFLSEMPSPFLATYAATKSFIKSLSTSMFYELRPSHIHVECVLPGVVCSKMSKVKKPSLFVPSAKHFAKCILDSVGTFDTNVPYFPHVLIDLLLKTIPSYITGVFTYRVMQNRQKMYREAKLRKEEVKSHPAMGGG